MYTLIIHLIEICFISVITFGLMHVNSHFSISIQSETLKKYYVPPLYFRILVPNHIIFLLI